MPGAYKFAVGKGSAYKTLQLINGVGAEDADVDLGWAQVHISAKGKELSMTFSGGKEAVEERWAMEREAMDELERESYAEVPEGEISERIPRGVIRRQVAPVGLQKVGLPQYRTRKTKVYLVNGQYVRDVYDQDFTQGGHHKVYPEFIPPSEIWLDRSLDTTDVNGEVRYSLVDRKATLLHELVESEDMGKARGKGEEYDEAHSEVANVAEREGRENPEQLEDMIQDFLDKYRPTEETANVPQRARVYNRRDGGNGREVKQVNNTYPSLPERYYMGRKLLPVNLGVNL